MSKPAQNVVGPQVRRLRTEAGLTQDQAVAKLQLKGWPISRVAYAQIEAQIRGVADYELAALARCFRVSLDELMPAPVEVQRVCRQKFQPDGPGRKRYGGRKPQPDSSAE